MIKAGTTLHLSSGVYSDYSILGTFVVLKDIDQTGTSEAFRATMPEKELQWSGRREFVAWLAKEGYIEDMTNQFEWHLGNYGFDPLRYVENYR